MSDTQQFQNQAQEDTDGNQHHYDDRNTEDHHQDAEEHH